MLKETEKKILEGITGLVELIEDKNFTIKAKKIRIDELEKKVEDLKFRFENERGSEEQYEATIKAQQDYIQNLEAKIYDLEERVAIMTESEAPLQPEWDITPPAKEVTEVINRTEVLEGGAE